MNFEFDTDIQPFFLVNNRYLQIHLEKVLKETNIDVVYTCGSKRLAKHIKKLQKEHHFLAFVSLEEHMACGIGACKGCVHNTINGLKRVCKEGPVFPVEEVIFDE